MVTYRAHPNGPGQIRSDELRPPESGHTTHSPGLFRSASRSGLTRYPGPSTPRGERAIVPNCDHQLMQHTHRRSHISPIPTVRAKSLPDEVRPPESGHSPCQSGPVPIRKWVGVDSMSRSNGPEEPSVHSIELRSPARATHTPMITCSSPPKRVGLDHRATDHDRPKAATAHTAQIRTNPKKGRV